MYVRFSRSVQYNNVDLLCSLYLTFIIDASSSSTSSATSAMQNSPATHVAPHSSDISDRSQGSQLPALRVRTTRPESQEVNAETTGSESQEVNDETTGSESSEIDVETIF